MAAVELVRLRLERALSTDAVTEAALQEQAQRVEAARSPMAHPPALETLVQIFRLSPFERDVVLLCAGLELNAAFAPLLASLQGDPQRAYPTLSVALATLPDPHWNALTPAAPLRHWRLVELGPGKALTLSPLRLDERILHYLTGLQHLDERLMAIVQPVPAPADPLVPSHRALVQSIAAVWGVGAGDGSPVIQLCGPEDRDRATLAAHLCQTLGLALYRLPVQALPTTASDLYSLQRLWEREARLSRSALMLEGDGSQGEHGRAEAIAQFIDVLDPPLLVSGRDRLPARQRPLVTFDIGPPTPAEQHQLWQTVLGPNASQLNGQVERLVSQFNLSAQHIQSAYRHAQGQAAADSPDALFQTLWRSCCLQSRPRLEDLAQRLDPAAGWDDLVLPEAHQHTLRTLAAHVRQRAKVYQQWGFAAKSHRGLGISALFAGPSGTGKTTAAEVLAQDLQLDLYRIDLSSVVSKYIGETEKNLRRIFDAAESGGVILLFDEADALFGKRSDVKDSHDRYANMEVSYLLQRIEAYQGLAILTTNLKTAIDTAFLRRIRFVVQFAFPDATQRAEIWRRMFPTDTPTQDLDYKRLAKLSVAGGNIRNIALNAAFIAADAGEPVTMTHLLEAAQSEYVKLERPLTDAEVKGWV
jgi:hypothetical protein